MSTPLENLTALFQDRPDVLRMLNLRELELGHLTDEQLKQLQRQRQLFPVPVNLYATGRTGAGKSSLGNSLFSDDPVDNPVLKTSGRQDCTDAVQYFQLISNLRYFDLPGAGSNETFENINRASLLIPQLNEPKKNMVPVNEFKVYDFSESPQIERQTTPTITEWNSFDNQQKVAPDIILYVVAPHQQFLRDDRRYLRALLTARKPRDGRNKVIFALNLHRTPEGYLKPTPQNIDDAKKGITEVYQQVYSTQDIPPIVEIDSLRGIGISQITELMCQMLPANRIGNIRQVLRGSLKQYAEEERSRRYRQALIQIAARLATHKVDEKLAGNEGILKEAYAAVSSYGFRVFRQEQAVAKAEQELYQLVSRVAAQAQISREEAIKVIEPIVQQKEKTEVRVRKIPEYRNREVRETQITYKTREVTRIVKEQGGNIFQRGWRWLKGKLGFSTERRVTETVREPVETTVTRIVREFVGMREEREWVVVGTYQAVVGQREKVIDTKAKQGGYVVVEDLLAIGLGLELEMADPSRRLNKKLFEIAVRGGRQVVQQKLSGRKEEINRLAESNQPKQAREAAIIHILQKAFISLPPRLVMQTAISRGKLTIGSGAGNDLLFHGPRIAKRHAHIGMEHGSYVISDYSGGNTAVSINGNSTTLQPVQKSALQDGSLIRVGHVTLLFHQPANGTPSLDVIYSLRPTGITIGSSPNQDITLSDPSVSARHASLQQQAGRWTVRDLNSAQGTFVSYKGHPTQERRILRINALKNGSTVRFGKVQFVFRTD